MKLNSNIKDDNQKNTPQQRPIERKRQTYVYTPKDGIREDVGERQAHYM